MAGKSQIEALYFNLGTHTEFYDALQVDTNGGRNKLDFAPTLGMGARLPLPWGFKFLPEINWVLPRHDNSHILKNILMFRGDIAYSPWNWIRFRMGTSLMWLNQQGQGGTARIKNGNETSTFYYPDENRSSLNNTFDLGLEFLYEETWALRLQTYTYALFNSDRRQVSYGLFGTYYWEL